MYVWLRVRVHVSIVHECVRYLYVSARVRACTCGVRAIRGSVAPYIFVRNNRTAMHADKEPRLHLKCNRYIHHTYFGFSGVIKSDHTITKFIAHNYPYECCASAY